MKWTIEELQTLNAARLFVYDILRRFYIAEPSKEYLKVIVENNLFSDFPFAEDSEGIREALDEINTYFQLHDPLTSSIDFENLHWDYTRMFIGPFEVLTPPWESFYVEKNSLLFQKTTLQIREFYSKHGLTTVKENIEPDDHIGMELDFVYQLINRTIVQLEKMDSTTLITTKWLLEEQSKFLNDHLLTFVPKLSAKIIDHAETSFYRGLAKLLIHFIQLDSKLLKELLK